MNWKFWFELLFSVLFQFAVAVLVLAIVLGVYTLANLENIAK